MGVAQMNVNGGDNSLNDLLAELNLSEEIVLDKEPTTIEVAPEVAAALAEIDAAEATGFEMHPAIPDGDAITETPKPAKKGKAEKKAKADKKAKEPAEPKVKKEPVERKHYANKVERITDKLGDKLGDFTVLEMADALLEGKALEAKQAETLSLIKSSGKKVQNRQTFILEFIAGKSTKLNYVIQTALSILSAEGSISMGVEGNLYKTLLAKPYSPNAAKAMGGNTVLALKTLKVIVDQEGKYVANPNSLILAKLKAMGAA